MRRAFMERYYQTYNSEDADALSAFYHPEVVLLSAQGEQAGRDSVLATYRYLVTHFVDRMTPERILVDGSAAAVEITDRFEARMDVPDFLGMSFSQGDTLTLHLCGIYTFDDEQIRQVCIYQR